MTIQCCELLPPASTPRRPGQTGRALEWTLSGKRAPSRSGKKGGGTNLPASGWCLPTVSRHSGSSIEQPALALTKLVARQCNFLGVQISDCERRMASLSPKSPSVLHTHAQTGTHPWARPSNQCRSRPCMPSSNPPARPLEWHVLFFALTPSHEPPLSSLLAAVQFPPHHYAPPPSGRRLSASGILLRVWSCLWPSDVERATSHWLLGWRLLALLVPTARTARDSTPVAFFSLVMGVCLGTFDVLLLLHCCSACIACRPMYLRTTLLLRHYLTAQRLNAFPHPNWSSPSTPL